MQRILSEIKAYKAQNEQEEKDQEELIWLIETYKEKAFTRDLKFGHITSSAIVVDENHKYILMGYHNIYQSMAWLGGHADGEFDLEKLSKREVLEETGLDGLKLIYDNISSLEILSVDGHYKRGKYVSTHLHYNVTYLYEGDMSKPTRIKSDENSCVKWIPISDLYEYVKNDHDMYHIYMKSLDRLNK